MSLNAVEVTGKVNNENTAAIVRDSELFETLTGQLPGRLT